MTQHTSRIAAQYARDSKDERPLLGYVGVLGAFSATAVAAAGLARLTGRTLPERLPAGDVALLAIATHKLSRLLAKDAVTSPLRAPFTTYEGVSAPSELAEQVRGHGLQHSVGELLTCPMCLAQWVATGLCAGLVLAPTPTRLAMTTLTAVAGSDFLQHLYAALQQQSS